MKNVLVLDDDGAFFELVAPLIEARGRLAIGVATVADALAVLRSREVEMAIVDYLLPDGNGGEFVAALRARGSNAILICLSASITGWAFFEQMQAELGISLVLRKPVFPKSFGPHLDSLLPIEVTAPARSEFMIAKMAGLHAKYLESLPGKLDELAQAILSVRTGNPDASESAKSDLANRARISVLAHRLHGSAASYGCPGVGKAAGKIEHLMEELASSQLSASEVWAEMDIAMGAARASLK